MIDFHTHPLLVREMIERYRELERAARQISFCAGGPCDQRRPHRIWWRS
jgi:hypothetical protein